MCIRDRIKQTKAVIQAESGTAGDPSMGLYIFLTASLRAGRADFEIPVLQETADVAEGLGDKFTYEILTSLDSAFRVEYLPPSMSAVSYTHLDVYKRQM